MYAAKNNCTTEELNKLKVSAISSEIKYNNLDNNNFEIVITNLVANFYIEDINAHGQITTTNNTTTKSIVGYKGGNVYTFNYFGSESSNCPHVLLRVQYLSIPKFNPYSEREECVGNEGFDLCSKWYPGTIKEEEFLPRLNEYIKDKKDEQSKPDADIEEPKEEIKGLWDKIMDYLNTKYIFVLVIIALVGIIGIILLKLFKRR